MQDILSSLFNMGHHIVNIKFYKHKFVLSANVNDLATVLFTLSPSLSKRSSNYQIYKRDFVIVLYEIFVASLYGMWFYNITRIYKWGHFGSCGLNIFLFVLCKEIKFIFLCKIFRKKVKSTLFFVLLVSEIYVKWYIQG